MGEFLEKSGYTSGYTKSCEPVILTNLMVLKFCLGREDIFGVELFRVLE